jgi:hypothetical protein
MSDVTEWIYDFAAEHINRYHTWKGSVWPRLKDAQGKTTADAAAYFADWAGMFAERGVTFDVARLASAEMVNREPQLHPGKHIEKFMIYVEQVWARKAVEDRTGAAPRTREHAQAASANCPECSGCGYAVRPYFHKPHDKEYNVTMFCLCLYGEWLAANFSASGPGSDAAVKDMKARTRRLAQYPELWDRKGHVDKNGNDRWPICWPLNPVPRDWPIESAWNREPYRDHGTGLDDTVSDSVEAIRLRITGQGPRRLVE